MPSCGRTDEPHTDPVDRRVRLCGIACMTRSVAIPGTPEQFGALIKSDMDKWGDIGKRLGVKLD